MKIRDRQDKVERMLSFYKVSKGSPFQEVGTHLRGEVDVLGALLLIVHVDKQHQDAIQRAGMRTGIDSRFTFETTIGEKDTLKAEFVARAKGQGDVLDSPLSLAKVHYEANISDWFSVVATPMGARCRDAGIKSGCYQEKGPTDYSFCGPPLLNERSGCAIGLVVRKSNVIASLAQFVSGLGMQTDSSGILHCFSTFGQIMYQLSGSTNISLIGMRRVPKMSSQPVNLGPMAIPLGIFKRDKNLAASAETSSSSIEANREEIFSSGSIAIMLESELDESTRIGGWVEMKNSNPKHLHWAVTMSDMPKDDLGWGLSLDGLIQGPKSWDRFQVETFLRMNLGDRFSLQPALVYVMDGTTQFPAVMLRTSWSL